VRSSRTTIAPASPAPTISARRACPAVVLPFVVASRRRVVCASEITRARKRAPPISAMVSSQSIASTPRGNPNDASKKSGPVPRINPIASAAVPIETEETRPTISGVDA
jgi:hypothetical protein